MRLVLLASLVLAAPALAQTAAISPEPHVVPFATSGNVVELAVSAESPEGLVASVVSAPRWVVFEALDASVHATEAVSRLRFDVDRSAPVGEPGTIEVAIADQAGQTVATRLIHVEVGAPETFALELPRPNPVQARAELPYALPAAARVEASVYDLLGRRVMTLVDGEREAGGHTLDVDAGALAAGSYVVRMRAQFGEQTRSEVRRITVVR